MKKKGLFLLSIILLLAAPTMMLGSVFGLTTGTVQYVEWILATTGNVALVVSIVASFGAGASIGGVIFALIRKRGVKWVAAW